MLMGRRAQAAAAGRRPIGGFCSKLAARSCAISERQKSSMSIATPSSTLVLTTSLRQPDVIQIKQRQTQR
jgi:hypothetical protein